MTGWSVSVFGGRSGATDGSSLRRRSRNGATSLENRSTAASSRSRSTGMAIDRRNDSTEPSRPGVVQSSSAQSSVEPVLDGGAGQCEAGCRGQLAHGPRGGRVGVLDLLRLVRDDQAPPADAELVDVSTCDAVGGDHHVGGSDVVDAPQWTVVPVHGHPRGEPFELALPVADDAGRAHHQGGTGDAATLVDEQVQCDELDRLAEAHVVREDAAEAEVGHLVHPREAPALVGAKRRDETRGLVDLVGFRHTTQAVREVGRGATDLDGDVVAVDEDRAAEGRGEGVGRRDLVPTLQLGDDARIDHDPLTAHLHQRATAVGQRSQLVVADDLSVERRTPGEGAERLEVERRRVVTDAGRRFRVRGGGEGPGEPGGDQDLDPRAGEVGGEGTEEPHGRGVVDLELGRRGFVEQDRQRSEQSGAAPQRDQQIGLGVPSKPDAVPAQSDAASATSDGSSAERTCNTMRNGESSSSGKLKRNPTTVRDAASVPIR